MYTMKATCIKWVMYSRNVAPKLKAACYARSALSDKYLKKGLPSPYYSATTYHPLPQTAHVAA